MRLARFLPRGLGGSLVGGGCAAVSAAMPRAPAGSGGHHLWCQPRSSSSSSSSSSRIGSRSSSSSSSAAPSSLPQPPAGGEVSSTSNAYVKHCVKLRESARYRQQQRRLLVAGGTLLQELTDAAGGRLHALAVFVKPGSSAPPGLSADAVIAVTDGVLRKLTGLEETGGVGVAAELEMPALVDLLSGEQQQQQQLQRLLVLDGVQDPGNLGTLLRCAAAFGWDAVWLLPGCCDPFNDKALRASRGAAFTCRLAAGGLQQLQAVVRHHGLLLVAAEPEPEPDKDGRGVDRAAAAAGVRQQPVALVLGAEGSGLSAEVAAAATPVAIPMVGAMESLNVAVAGSILMFALSGGLPLLAQRLEQLGLAVDARASG